MSYKYRKCTVVQICDENYHIYLDSNGDMRLKHSSPWYFQIQCQLAVADVLYCDFVMYMYLEGLAACKHKIHVDINSFYAQFVVPN